MTTIGFIGAGNMAEAIIHGILDANIYNKKNIVISDVNEERLNLLKKNHNLSINKNNITLVQNSKIIVLCIKPQKADEVLSEIKKCDLKDKIIISIMAGKKISYIKSFLGQEIKVVRIMPNTPALIKEGMSVLSKDDIIDDQEFNCVKNIFCSIGKIVELDENMMDIVTAISGSGPAYVYYFAEIMIEYALAAGISIDKASLLVKQTFLGAASMMSNIDEDPKQLRQKVTSPGGTTEAALKFMEENNLKEFICKALDKAKLKSIELSGGK